MCQDRAKPHWAHVSMRRQRPMFMNSGYVSNIYSIVNIKVKSYKRHIVSRRWENDFIHSDIQDLFYISHDEFKYIIIFLDDKILRFIINFLSNKSELTILIAFKFFLNQVEYENSKCIRLRTNCDSKYNNYKIYIFRLSKGIIWEANILEKS